MIVFGVPLDDEQAYIRYAERGIRRAAGPGSEVLALEAVAPPARAYNLLLEQTARRDELEALVIVHPRAEIDDPGFLDTVRRTLAGERVAIAGCIGASGVSSVAWWDGDVVAGRVRHRYTELGGGEVAAFAWRDPAPAPAPVDAVPGWLMALSPWAVRNLRFDESLSLGPGFDVDFCLQAREAGRTVMVADLGVVLHAPLEIAGDPERFIAAHMALARKREPGEGTDWKARARRAEAEREAVRIEGYFQRLDREMRVQELERRLEELTSAPGWRLTEPLRRANHWRLSRRARAGSRPLR